MCIHLRCKRGSGVLARQFVRLGGVADDWRNLIRCLIGSPAIWTLFDIRGQHGANQPPLEQTTIPEEQFSSHCMSNQSNKVEVPQVLVQRIRSYAREVCWRNHLCVTRRAKKLSQPHDEDKLAEREANTDCRSVD